MVGIKYEHDSDNNLIFNQVPIVSCHYFWTQFCNPLVNYMYCHIDPEAKCSFFFIQSCLILHVAGIILYLVSIHVIMILLDKILYVKFHAKSGKHWNLQYAQDHELAIYRIPNAIL